MENLFFLWQMVPLHYQEETTNSKNTTLRREPTVRRENLGGESQGDREEFQPEETNHDEEIHEDVWSVQGDFFLSLSY